MKGTIVSAWVQTCKELYGEEITKESLSHFGINKIEYLHLLKMLRIE